MARQILELRVSHKGIKPVRNGHPWIFNNTLAGAPKPGRVSSSMERAFFGPEELVWDHTDPVVVCDQSGEPIGWGSYNPRSRLAVRMLTRTPQSPLLRSVLDDAVRRAVAARHPLLRDPQQEAFRLIFGEADGLPGVVADLYGEVVSVQYSGAFAWDNRELIESVLRREVAARRVGDTPERVEIARRFDTTMLRREGLPEVAGDEDARAVTVLENGLPWRVYPWSGQKTGLYCDQRENRAVVAGIVANLSASGGVRVLDGFCYHGGFGLQSLAAGAQYACFLDSSAEALEIVRENAALQKVPAERYECVRGDLFEALRRDTVPGGIASYDVIVLDPPKLVPSRRAFDDGLRAYKDLNLSVLRYMKPGARLVTFSCSGAVGAADLRRTIAWAASDLGRTVVIEGILSHPPDHPIPLAFPEAEYLKGLVLRT
ncbi:MAG: class I SAM-dependent rRNA methyltransferase [Alkalispirochaeta sp.]